MACSFDDPESARPVGHETAKGRQLTGSHTTRKRAARRGLAAFIAAGVVLAAGACGGDDDDDATATVAPADSEAPAGDSAPDATDAPGETTPPDAPGTTAASAPAEPVVGVTDDTIRISVSIPATGYAWDYLKPAYTNGVEMWAKEVNANGGIHGRQVEIVKVDNLYTIEGGAAACKEIENNDTFMVLAPASTTEEIDCLDAAGIPVFVPAPSAMRDEWTNVVAGVYGPLMAEPVVSFWQSSYLVDDLTKVGIICRCYNNVVAHEVDELAKAAEAQGIEVVVESWEQNATSFVPQVTKLKDADVQLVAMFEYGEGPKIIQAAQSIGFDPVFTLGIYSGSIYDSLARAGGGIFEGMHSTMIAPSSDTEAFTEFREKVRTYVGEDEAAAADSFDLFLYGLSAVVGEMLTQAGANPTRESFNEAARNIDNFDSGFLVPFSTVGQDPPIGITTLFPATCCNPDGTWQVIGPAASEF